MFLTFSFHVKPVQDYRKTCSSRGFHGNQFITAKRCGGQFYDVHILRHADLGAQISHTLESSKRTITSEPG